MGYLNLCMGAALLALLPLTTLQAAGLEAVQAAPASNAAQAMMLGVTRAKERLVAVGDHGMVLLSDDQGHSFRQASSVPVSTPLTSVSFADSNQGWAVGQWGAILATVDGGETWQTQRLSSDEDRPLFAVHFFNSREGVAVGLWSLVLTTDDGGKTWMEQRLQPPEGYSRADLNLISLFADPHGTLYTSAERGQVLRSDDKGKTWRYLDTGYEGSLWAGAVLADGSLLVGGQRGTLLHSSADGNTWRRVPLKSKSSITAITTSGTNVVVGGLDGLLMESHDNGGTFEEQRTADGVSITAALFTSGDMPLLMSSRGVLPMASP